MGTLTVNFFHDFRSTVLNGNVFLAILLALHPSCCQYYLESVPCGTLYSEGHYQGQQYFINDRQQSLNLPEDLNSTEVAWDNIGSYSIEDGCSMEVCDQPYFDGNCQTLAATGSEPGTVSLTLSNALSVGCTCPKECKCSDIFIKKSSCGRAYLKGGCGTCNALYTDLVDSNSKTTFPDAFVSKVEAFRLRKGCSVTLFSEEDSNEGDETLISDETVENFSGKIHSYQCHCNDAAYEPRPPAPRPASYPPMIQIPDTVDDVVRLLSTNEYKDHPGLRAALQSLRNNRSSNHAYILLLGTTGSGKSSAINLLFDNPNVTKVGGRKSTTTDIHEFRIPVDVDEIGVANSELRVIDTPGLGDTRGLEQDSKFLATLDSFLSNHEELKDRIPNVVFIFHKYSDNRFDGLGSQFVKMLRGFDSFRNRITDENFSNIIFVLSHFCSETIENVKRPGKRLRHFKEVIENFSSFPKPTLIAVAENKPEDHHLPMENGYHKLPNQEYYPSNLFQKMELVTRNGGDMMGMGIFRAAFRDSENFNITSHTFRLLDSRNSRVDYYLRILSNTIFGVKNTEVSQLLQKVWDKEMDAELKSQFPYSLVYLQKSLNLKNINVMEDIPRTSVAILDLLTGLKNDEATRVLLDKALHIKPPVFDHNTVAGYSYNVFKDTYLPTSPLKLGDLQQSDIGFLIPKVLTCKLERRVTESFFVFKTKEEYLQHRLKNLGIEGTISNTSFVGNIKPGHNIKELTFKRDSCSLSATREFRMFELILNDRLDLTSEFKAVVQGLPPFNETDHDNVEQWKSFFNDYGTHVVKSVYGGGSIEIELQSDQPFNSELAQAMFDFIKFAEDVSYLVDLQTDAGRNSLNMTVLKEGVSHSLSFQGGDSAYHTADLTKMSIEKASQLLNRWQKSLKFSPTILNTEMRLIPISHVVRKLGQNYTAEIERATTLLFNSQLNWTPPKRTPMSDQPYSTQVGAPAPSREATPLVSEALKAMQEMNQKFQMMMMDIKRMEAENEQKRMAFEQKKLEWEQEKHRQDEERKLEADRRHKEQQERYAEDQRRHKEEQERFKQEQETRRQEAERKHQLELERYRDDQRRYQEEQRKYREQMERRMEEDRQNRLKQEQEHKARMEREKQEWEREKQRIADENRRRDREQEEKRAEERREYERRLREAQERADERAERMMEQVRRPEPPPCFGLLGCFIHSVFG